jgi:hypothetical protein
MQEGMTMFKRFAFGALAAVGLASSASAAAISGSASLQSAIESVRPVQTVACWRYGWRGWAVYPGCFRPPYYVRPPYVVAPPYYAPGPVYAAPPVYVRPRRCWINGAWRVC